MKVVAYIPLALACIFGLTACSDDDSPKVADDESVITFVADIPELVTSKSSVLTGETFTDFYVTSFFGAHDFGGQGVDDLTYFNDIHFQKKDGETEYTSEVSYLWPVTTLEFFAYYPSLETMQANKNDAEALSFSSHTGAGYKLSGFGVHSDISRHLDFMTAHASATYRTKQDATVNLEFNHALSQVELRGSFTADPAFNLEVAGVRIVNPETSGVFNLCGNNHNGATEFSSKGAWELAEKTAESRVEYIYKSAESLVTIKKGDAVSLMGNGGNALLIPTNRAAWNAKEDVANSGMGCYFGVLIRVTTAEGLPLYPAIGLEDKDQVQKVYFACDNANKILSRVYKNAAGQYFSDEALTTSYTVPAGATVKEFGWAAVPVDIKWASGKKYAYNLNFSSGVGIRDPHDNHPADPILGGVINFTVTFEEWGAPVNKDIDMPSKKNDTNS